MSSGSNRVSANLSKGQPLATVRREQTAFDPLFDYSPVGNRGSSSSLGLPTQAESELSPVPPQVPAAFLSSRLSSTSDVTDLMADAILQEAIVRPINANEIPVNKEGIILLAKNAAWAQVARWGSNLLPSLDQSQTSLDEYYTVLLLRFEALYRLKMFDELISEVSNVLSSKFDVKDKLSDTNLFDIYCSLRLLKYEVSVQSGQGQAGFQELQDIQVWLHEQLQKGAESSELVRANYWLWQIDLNFVNYYVRNRNWKTAIQLHRKLLLQINQLLIEFSSSTDCLDLTAAKIMLLCRTSRLLLQIGASKAAHSYFEESSSLLSSNPVLNSDGYLQSLLLVSQGFIQFSEDKYDKAAETFSTFLDGEWSKLYEISSRVAVQPVEVLNKPKAMLSLMMQAKDENLYCSAINNYAICCLYLKRNSDSITRLERLIGRNPPKYMTDPIVFNLCTMYDLSYSPDVSLAKKKALQKISAKYGLNDPILHWRSFRLN